MRLPNGFGSVIHLSGNRRRPFLARKTVGYNDLGRQIYYNLGYFTTREEAIHALSDYNRKSVIVTPNITLSKLQRYSRLLQSDGYAQLCF